MEKLKIGEWYFIRAKRLYLPKVKVDGFNGDFVTVTDESGSIITIPMFDIEVVESREESPKTRVFTQKEFDKFKKALKDIELTKKDFTSFDVVCDYMKELHERKNHDYGDAFGVLFEEYGVSYALAHLEEKLLRLKSVFKNGNKVNGESAKDSLIDIACYSVMTYNKLENER